MAKEKITNIDEIKKILARVEELDEVSKASRDANQKLMEARMKVGKAELDAALAEIQAHKAFKELRNFSSK